MPIFTYECRECDKEVELIRHFSERDEPAFCKRCGAQLVHKIESPAPFQWGKGGSWTK